MKSLPFLACAFALAACSKESDLVESANSVSVQTTVHIGAADTGSQIRTKTQNANTSTLEGLVSLWSGKPTAVMIATPTEEAPAPAPTLTPEQRMVDQVRRFREGQRLRQMKAESGYPNVDTSGRAGDKVGLRPGDVAGKTPNPAAAAPDNTLAAVVPPPVISPEARLAAKERMAEQVRRFREGQALRLAQANSNAVVAVSATPSANSGGGRTGDSVGVRPGDSIGLRPGDKSASY